MPYVPFPAFDADEEDPPVGFEQDPDSDDIGHGSWTYADGSRKYGAGDPELAKSLLDKSASLANGGTEPAPSVDDQFLNSTTAAEQEDALPDEQQPLGGAAPEAPEQPKSLAPLAAPALPGSRGPARYTDKSESTDQQSESVNNQSSVSRTGSAQDEGEFQRQQADIAQGYNRQGQAADEGANSVVAAQQQRKNALMQMAADKEAVTAAAQASSEARKAAVIKKYQEVDSRKTDINQLWKDKGALGTTLGLLGVALRSLNATKFGGPNTALQSIQEQKKQAIQAQLDDRNSELRGLERELGSIEAAAPMLEARMNDALSKRLDAMTIDEKSATVLANAKTMKAQFETEKASKMAESAKAFWGTLAKQQSTASQLGRTQGTSLSRDRVSGAGIGGAGKKPMTPKELAEQDKALEAAGIGPVERAKIWQQNGMAPPTEKTEAQYKRDQQEADDKRKAQGEDGKRDVDQGKAQAALDTVDQVAQAKGLRRVDGKWTVGGKKSDDKTIEAYQSQAVEALKGMGQDEDAAERAVGAESHTGHAIASFAIPFYGALTDAVSPEDLAARLNAAELAIKPRAAPADRAAQARDRGAIPHKKVGNMNTPAP
jgi:hypothetical protein